MNPLLATLKRPRAISLTPLIDVVFILLMFFMLTSSFIRERQMELASPVASASETPAAPQIVQLSANGDWLDIESQQTLTHTELNQLDHSGPLVVRPAGDASVQTIVSALEQLKKQGFEQVSLGRALSLSELSLFESGH